VLGPAETGTNGLGDTTGDAKTVTDSQLLQRCPPPEREKGVIGRCLDLTAGRQPQPVDVFDTGGEHVGDG